VVLVTEWKQFSKVNLKALRKTVRTPVFLDGRNAYSPRDVAAAGFNYYGVGRPPQGAATRSS
jgi:UDPglucose 6-dehydrogenase